MKSNTK